MIDTREKRFSLLNFGDGSHIHVTFESDGSVDLDDRQHLLDCYSGIAFAAPFIPPVESGPTGTRKLIDASSQQKRLSGSGGGVRLSGRSTSKSLKGSSF